MAYEAWMVSTKECIFKGCGRAAYSRGLCASHYKQLNRLGERLDPTPDRLKRLTPLRTERMVKFPGVSLVESTAKQVMKLDRNPYRALQKAVDQWAKEHAA